MRRCCSDNCANRSPYVLPTMSGLTSTCACAREVLDILGTMDTLWHAMMHVVSELKELLAHLAQHCAAWPAVIPRQLRHEIRQHHPGRHSQN